MKSCIRDFGMLQMTLSKPALPLVTHCTGKGLNSKPVQDTYTFLCLFFLKYITRFQSCLFLCSRKEPSSLGVRNSPAVPYFPHSPAALHTQPALLFACPTLLLGVPSLAHQAPLAQQGIAQGLVGLSSSFGITVHFCLPNCSPGAAPKHSTVCAYHVCWLSALQAEGPTAGIFQGWNLQA